MSASERHCYAHDPANAERRSRLASKAARSKPNRELAALKDQLRAVADGVLGGIIVSFGSRGRPLAPEDILVLAAVMAPARKISNTKYVCIMTHYAKDDKA